MRPSRQIRSSEADSAAESGAGAAGRPERSGRPGRPDKRRAIIDAAKEVFLRQGFTDTSVDVVAAEAGVSKQTVYNHFGDKTNLFTAVIETAQQDTASIAEERFAAFFRESGDMEADLRAAARIWTDMVLAPEVSGLRRVIIAEQWRHPEIAAEWSRPRPAFEDALVAELEPHVAAGDLDIPDVHVAAHQLILLTVHEAIHASHFGLHHLSDHQVRRIVDDGVDMWLRSYRARPAPQTDQGVS
ncbi:TetR/AcrR family transcriptional regulator [Uniformispora flossi]|uniref:TetR/AcrR family transcriptional regulator n=1 Tax=Uniformispora flossi TaxID=3390723 RepID=UPI003C302E65